MSEVQISGMVDIHSHILPGLDDGAKDIDESIRMCSMAAEDGIRKIVASPHHLNGSYSNPKDTVAASVASLNAALRERNIGIEVLPGADLRFCAELMDEIKSGRAITINDGGKFILLEPPGFFVPAQLKEHVFRLKLMGITPVITHPERNTMAMEDAELLFDMVAEGALIQITAGSITGELGSAAEKSALLLAEMGMAHIVASDAHGLSRRSPRLSLAYKILSGTIGEEEARKAVIDRPDSVLRGIMPKIEKPVRPSKKGGILSRLGLKRH